MSPSVAARALKEEPILSASQTNKGDASSNKIDNPLIYSAAQSLIDLHRRNPDQPVKIEIFDVPHDALVQVSEQLDELGASHHVRDALITALKDYVMSKGGSFARAANAKPVYIAIQVADSKPESKFEQGVTEIAAVDGMTSRVEGASAINVRLTNTGTAMTSNVADVDRMFAGVKGDKLWIQFEAPTKQELAGLLNQQELALAAVGETIGGAISAAELEDVLQKLQDEGLVTAEIVTLLESMIEVRALVEAGVDSTSKPRIAELSQKISELIKSGLETGGIPVFLAKGAVQSIETLVDTHNLQEIIPVHEIAELSTQVKLVEITQKVEGLIEMVGPDDVATIEALESVVEVIKSTDVEQVSDIVSEVSAVIADLDLPEAALETVTNIEQIVSTIKQDMPVSDTTALEVKADLAAEDLVELLQSLDAIEDLPPELQAQLAKIEEAGFPIAEITADQVAQALTGKATPELNDAIQHVVLALNDPAIQKALPQPVLNTTNAFLSTNAVVVEAVAIQAIMTDMSAALDSGKLTAEQAEVIQTVLTKLEGGEGLTSIAPETLKEIVTNLDSANKGAISSALQVLENTQTPNVVISQETMDKVENLTVLVDAVSQSPDISPETVDAAAKDIAKDLSKILESGGVTAEQAKVIQTVLTKLEGGDNSKPVTPEVLKAAVAQLESSIIESTPTKWSPDTLMNMQAMADLKILPPAATHAVQQFLQNPNDKAAIANVRTTMGDMAPPQIVAAYVARAPIAAIAAEIRILSQAVTPPKNAHPMTAPQKKPFEAMKSVAKMLERLPEGKKISPAEAEILLRKINEGRVVFKDSNSNIKIDAIRDEIINRTLGGAKAIPTDVVKGECIGCGGGKCRGCSPDYNVIAAETKTIEARRGLSLGNSHHTLYVAPAPVSTPEKTATPIMQEIKILGSIADDMRADAGRQPSSEERLYIESIRSVERSLNYYEQKGIDQYSAIQAEVMIRQLNQGLVGIEDPHKRAQIEQTIEKILDHTIGGRDAVPEDVRTGKCIGCAGGACAGCGQDQRVSAAEARSLSVRRGTITLAPEVNAA